MGKLDERAFATTVAGCKKCDAKVFEVASFIDRNVTVMLGEPKDDGRWVHEGKNFIDGIYRVQCVRCRSEAFASGACPRCHRGRLADVIGARSRLAVPKRCPECKGVHLTVSGFAPAVLRIAESRPASPTPTALLGDPSFHVAQITCDTCDWVTVAEGCPLCGSAGPLRPRPA